VITIARYAHADHYGVHSNIAHGGLAATAYRFGTAQAIVSGCEYDEAAAGLVINEISILLRWRNDGNICCSALRGASGPDD